jgi:hypothetical protein
MISIFGLFFAAEKVVKAVQPCLFGAGANQDLIGSSSVLFLIIFNTIRIFMF